MKVELFPFQTKALTELREKAAYAIGFYNNTHAPQVISFTAPTGAGKTIIMSSLIESILYGDERFPEQPDAVFVWLSDSPELNQQSKDKIETKSDRINIHQCITIEDASFDREILEDGHIYFLNTQKLSKTSRLTSHADGRNYTIWETLQNTAEQKSDRLYFIIDEAHRGMQGRDASKATSIMQKFIKGSAEVDMKPMPVVIGMSATTERFNNLISNIPSTVQKTVITAEEVRDSGLLKDRIIITYPDESTHNKDMAVLQAAADEWRNKWDHWTQYCREQHYAYINPVFVVQVLNGTRDSLTETDLDDCLSKIEQRTGFRFTTGEVVHCFGEGTKIVVNGLEVPYEEPSRISDDKNIKVVFFKESLSTGWDCPRAETMMSFRRANDSTYIAQLLGRMVRTPMQMRVMVDDSLNDVHLYLPHFNAATVKEIVKELQSSEGGDIPAEVYGEEMGDVGTDMLTIRPKRSQPTPPVRPTETYTHGESGFGTAHDPVTTDSHPEAPQVPAHQETHTISPTDPLPAHSESTATEQSDAPEFEWQYETYTEPAEKVLFDDGIDREAIIKYINDAAFPTYEVRTVRISSYLNSLYRISGLLTHSMINQDIQDEVRDEVVEMIHDYITDLKSSGKYDALRQDVLEFKLRVQIFDVFGESVDNFKEHDILSATDTDIDRQLRQAEAKLGNGGIAWAYGKKYADDDDMTEYKIDVILFAADEDCQVKLNTYAKDKFNELHDTYYRKIARLGRGYEKFVKQYNDIVSNSDLVTKHNFALPETIGGNDQDGKEYEKHLFVNDETGIYKVKLNSWESGVLEEEMRRDDFICWLRNPPRKSWSLAIPYLYNGETKPAFPDFIIVRSDPDTDYIVDFLEPHRADLDDNLPKAKGFAKYASENPEVGKIQLIREGKDPAGNKRYRRLDLRKRAIQEKVLQATTPEELNHIFDTEGFYD